MLWFFAHIHLLRKGGLVVTTKRNGKSVSCSQTCSVLQLFWILGYSLIHLSAAFVFGGRSGPSNERLDNFIQWMSYYLLLYGQIMERLLYYNISLANINHNLLSQAQEYTKTLTISSLAVQFKNWLLTCLPENVIQALVFKACFTVSVWTFCRRTMQTDYFCVWKVNEASAMLAYS